MTISRRSVLGAGLAGPLLASPFLIRPASAQRAAGKTDRVNLREGPSKEHRTRWVYQRAGLPMEVTAEFETWRRVRDADGTEGWVLHSLLSGRRTALVAPWSKKKDENFPMRSTANEDAAVVAKLQPGVVASVASCVNTWCRVSVGNINGFIRQERLWGVYPNEKVD